MAKPIIVRTDRGAEYGYRTVTDATRVLGKGRFEVLRYADGSPYTPPKPKKAEPKPEKKD